MIHVHHAAGSQVDERLVRIRLTPSGPPALKDAIDPESKDAVFAASKSEKLGRGVLVVGVAEGGLEGSDRGTDAEIGGGEGGRLPEEAGEIVRGQKSEPNAGWVYG